MIQLRWNSGSCPAYQTQASAGADLIARESMVIERGQTVLVPTGVWIEQVLWDQIPPGGMPELQVRARSSLAYKHQLILPNGIGTIDVDYRDEIRVLMMNLGSKDFFVEPGLRIAQMVLAMTYRIPGIPVPETERQGGFGSTGV
jgi:dUTP pyrophosphatase